MKNNLNDYLYELYLESKLISDLIFKTYDKNLKLKLFNILKRLQTQLIDELNSYSSHKLVYNTRNRQTNEYTVEELSQFNGKNGYPAYVAVDGIIYDITTSPTWENGMHFDVLAGKNLTKEFYNCHSAKDILEKYPKVGILVQSK